MGYDEESISSAITIRRFGKVRMLSLNKAPVDSAGVVYKPAAKDKPSVLSNTESLYQFAFFENTSVQYFPGYIQVYPTDRSFRARAIFSQSVITPNSGAMYGTFCYLVDNY